MIYLMSPYLHEDETITEQRIVEAAKAAGFLMEMGFTVFSPICSSCLIEKHYFKSKTAFENWKKLDFFMLDICDHSILLMLPEWEHSYGILQEILYCSSKHISNITTIKPVRDGYTFSQKSIESIVRRMKKAQS